MAETAHAIFLSYASQDSEAARRLCDALRAAGVEVWFDRSALRGGDAWDAMIRRQVRECALFVPIVSANTQAREEGYFRLEWKLAVDRSYLMADNKAFLLPVLIDATSDAAAIVPDRFRAVQWTRLPGGQGAEAFAERVRQLLRGGVGPTVAAVVDAPAKAPPAAGSDDEAPSIAVLPFVNLSRDEENEYFADGLAEELLNVLSKIHGLRVASRTSTFWFKGKSADLATVAQKLGVATILEGSVRKAGNRVRITAQLIEVAKDAHLWSGTYDRQLDDIFAVQDDIASAVVEELRGALLRKPAKEVAVEAKAAVAAASAGRGDNAEAHRLYLQGRYYQERRKPEDAAKAADYFEQAIALDPEFALGWVGLAAVRINQANYGWLPVQETFEAARTAVQHAIALNPHLAEAHVAVGKLAESYDWDWPAAQREFEHALALAPGSADAQHARGFALARLGREEGLTLMRQAGALDPLSSIKHRVLGDACVYFGHYDEAERELRAALDLSPTAGAIHCGIAILCLAQGRAQEALEYGSREPIPVFRDLSLACAHHSLGRREESDATLERMIAAYADTGAYQIAQVVAWRGEVDRAFEWLERAYEERDPGMGTVFVEPFFRPIRNDPRWHALLKKLRFVD
jgi:TolB-like protein/Tfp pilus assembly protein PilF